MTAKEMIYGMAASFNKSYADGVNAIIRFHFTDQPDEDYSLQIQNQECTVLKGHKGEANLIIHTPTNIWWDISNGKLEGQQALMDGDYWVEGDFTLMIKFDQLFAINAKKNLKDVKDTGPLPIGGMQWLFITWIPWTIFFIFARQNPFLGAIGATVLSFSIFLYRWKWIELSAFDIGSIIFFPVMSGISLIAPSFFAHYGKMVGCLIIALIWQSSLITGLPLTASYSKWGYPEGYENLPIFLKTNEIITLVWADLFIVMVVLDILTKFNPEMGLMWTIIQQILIVAIGIFTVKFEGWYPAYVASNPKRKKVVAS